MKKQLRDDLCCHGEARSVHKSIKQETTGDAFRVEPEKTPRRVANRLPRNQRTSHRTPAGRQTRVLPQRQKTASRAEGHSGINVVSGK